MSVLKDDTIEQIPLFDVGTVKDKVAPAKVLKPATAGIKDTPTPNKVNRGTGKAAQIVKEGSGKKKKVGIRNKVIIKSPVSGQVPEGDVRLTANIREDLHLKLKIAAARRRTTIGELLEELVDRYL